MFNNLFFNNYFLIHKDYINKSYIKKNCKCCFNVFKKQNIIKYSEQISYVLIGICDVPFIQDLIIEMLCVNQSNRILKKHQSSNSLKPAINKWQTC